MFRVARPRQVPRKRGLYFPEMPARGSRVSLCWWVVRPWTSLGATVPTAASGSLRGPICVITFACVGSELRQNYGRKDQDITSVLLMAFGIPDDSDGKESACSVGDPGSIPGSGISPGEGNGTPLQYSCLENSMDRGAWWATVHGVAKIWT